MSREIKFRAWDGSKMHITDFHLTCFGVTWKHDDDRDDESNKYILQQYTGLKDKNGVEIYEGDICEVDNNQNASHLQTVNCNYAKPLKKGDLLIIKKLLSGYTGQILSNQADIPNLIGNVSNYSLWNGARQLRVIGNIYQNQYLLK